MRMRSLSSLLLLALCCCPFASTWAANETKYAYTHAPTVFYTSIEQGCADLTNARINDSWNITGFVFYKNNQCFYSATNVKTGVSYPDVSGQTPVYVGTCVAGESTSVSWPLGPRDTSFPNNVNPASATVPPWPVCVSGCMAEYVSVDSCFAVSEQSPVYIHCDYNAKRTGEACATNDAPPPPDVSDCPAGTVLTGTDCVAVPPVDPCIAEPTGPGCTGGGDTGGGDTGGGDTGGGDTGGGDTGGGDTGGGDTGGGDTGGGDTGGGDTGGGDTGGGDTGSAGGLGCKDPFVCSGDSVGCAMVQLQKIQRCESERGLDPELGKAGIAEAMKDPDGDIEEEEIQIASLLSGHARFLPSSCPPAQTFTVWGRQFAFKNDYFCNFATSMSWLVVAMASLFAAVYIGKSVGGS